MNLCRFTRQKLYLIIYNPNYITKSYSNKSNVDPPPAYMSPHGNNQEDPPLQHQLLGKQYIDMGCMAMGFHRPLKIIAVDAWTWD